MWELRTKEEVISKTKNSFAFSNIKCVVDVGKVPAFLAITIKCPRL
jgi:hypothetical protein